MAEIVGIVASAAALVQLVRYGKKSAHALYQFSRHAGVSQDDIERCADQIRSFSLTVGCAHESLDQHLEDCTGSAVLDFISGHGVLDAISVDADSVSMRLELAAKRFGNLAKGKRTLPAFIRWWLHKDAVVSLFPEMERVKTNLMLIILVVRLELQTKRKAESPPTSPDIKKLEKRMSRLRSNIRSYLKTIDGIQEQIDRADHRKNLMGPVPSRDSLTVSYDALFELGESMVKTGGIPKTTPGSQTSSIHDLPNMEFLQSTSSVSTSGTVFTKSDGSHETFESRTQPRQARKPVQSLPVSMILRVEERDNSKAMTLSLYYEGRKEEPKSFIAKINKKLDGNIISILEANRLGLEVVPQDDSERRIEVVFDDGKPQRCIGVAELNWSERVGKGWYRPGMKLRLYVVENCRSYLILGRSFTTR